jgi:hypothetical protein
MPGMLPPGLVWGRFGCAPKGPTQASYIARAQPILNMTWYFVPGQSHVEQAHRYMDLQQAPHDTE